MVIAHVVVALVDTLAVSRVPERVVDVLDVWDTIYNSVGRPAFIAVGNRVEVNYRQSVDS